MHMGRSGFQSRFHVETSFGLKSTGLCRKHHQLNGGGRRADRGLVREDGHVFGSRRLTAEDHAERSEHVRFSTLDQPKQNIAKKIELALAKQARA